MTLLAERTGDVSDTSAEEVLASHFTLVAEPDAIEPITLDGADGWTSPNPHPALSLMRWTTADPEVAATALDQVVDRFRAEGRGFDWMTGPRCAAAAARGTRVYPTCPASVSDGKTH